MRGKLLSHIFGMSVGTRSEQGERNSEASAERVRVALKERRQNIVLQRVPRTKHSSGLAPLDIRNMPRDAQDDILF